MGPLIELMHGFEAAMAPAYIGMCFLGVLLGQIIGALPGIGRDVPQARSTVVRPVRAGQRARCTAPILFRVGNESPHRDAVGRSPVHRVGVTVVCRGRTPSRCRIAEEGSGERDRIPGRVGCQRGVPANVRFEGCGEAWRRAMANASTP